MAWIISIDTLAAAGAAIAPFAADPANFDATLNAATGLGGAGGPKTQQESKVPESSTATTVT
jgi:hypothetical protein